MSCSDGVAGSVRVVESVGKLPTFWNRDAVFVANLLGLFFENEEQTRMLAREVGEMDSYGGRLLPIVDLVYGGSGRNMLVLESHPDLALSRYFEEVAGLSLPDVEILPHRDYLRLGDQLREGKRHEVLDKLEGHGAGYIDGYVTDATISEIADYVGMATFSSEDGSRYGNNKWRLHEHLETVGLPVPVTCLAESVGDLSRCLGELHAEGFRSGVIKAPMGASGIGLVKVPDVTHPVDLKVRVPDHFFMEGPCLVQGWIEPGESGVRDLYSPSVQLFLSDDEVVMYDITEQILSKDSIHEGNEAPPPYLRMKPEWRREMLRQAEIAGSWLHGQGYRGTASADFLLAEKDDGAFDVYVCELNARVTGATYPSVLARHFMPDGAWLLRNLRFNEPLPGDELMELLLSAHELYVPGESSHGIFPVNFNVGKDGLVHKGQFLCLAPTTSGSELLLQLAKLKLPCEATRD